MLAQTLLLASLASACWAQCVDNDNFPGTVFPGGCDDFPTLTPFTSTAPFYIAIVGGVVFLLLCIILSCCAARRRQYAIRQNPGVAPPIFGSAPPAYGVPFWTGNMQASSSASPISINPNAGNGASGYGHGQDVEANGNGVSRYERLPRYTLEENGGVGSMEYPPPPPASKATPAR